jgi:hypothetical protein
MKLILEADQGRKVIVHFIYFLALTSPIKTMKDPCMNNIILDSTLLRNRTRKDPC